MRRFLLPVVLAIVALQPCGSWAKPTRPAVTHTPGDPWERTNRRIFAINQALDRAVLAPLSRLTNAFTPGPLGKGIHNFLVNLNEPVVIINDLLQVRPGPAVRAAFRLFINTTAGGLGAIDVAKALGDPSHKNGFGDTLGRWGMGPGPYLYLLVLGPSSVRDLFGSVVDDATLPIHTIDYPYRTEVDITVAVVGGLNERAYVGKDLDALLSGAADPYATLRSSYLQAREAEIRGQTALPPLPDIEDGSPQPAPAAPSGPTEGTEGPAASPAASTPATPPPEAPASAQTPSPGPSDGANPDSAPASPPATSPASPTPPSP